MSKFTIMHISDLHRATVNPLTNAELVSALIADRGKMDFEAPLIPSAEALIVTGDLVQGLVPGGAYPQAIRDQYAEAHDFLVQLAEIFFGGDRSRVLILPGNHDVDWTIARKAMAPVTITPALQPNVSKLLSAPQTKYRWNWGDQSLWQIVDEPTYADRLALFQDFTRSFYANAHLNFPYEPARDWNVFSLAEGAVIAAAFNSCASNDCYSRIGQISNDAIAQCYMFILDNTKPDAVRIAAWHHNTEGSPTASDYLDASTIRLLIDRGFAIGLHGHQHKSDAPPPHVLFTSGKYEMLVLSAGSLCAGSPALPQGYNPQYNLVELDLEEPSVTVHVREMIQRGVFSQGRLNVLNHASWSKALLRAAPPGRLQGTGTSGGIAVKELDEIEMLRSTGRRPEALRKLIVLGDSSVYARRLRLTLLTEMNDWAGIRAAFPTADNLDEGLVLIRAAIETRDPDGADRALKDAEGRFAIPAQATTDFRSRISALRAMIR